MIPRKITGGVRTIVAKLIEGLSLEGFNVKPITYSLGIDLIQSLKMMPNICNCGAIIYTSSIPILGHIPHSKCTRTVLFVHGYTKYQLLNSLSHGNVFSIYIMGLWKIAKVARKIHKYICLCKTACEINGIQENYIILPEFIFPGEAELYEKISKRLRENNHRDVVRIITYTSHVTSPRLLNVRYVERLVKIIGKRINKKLELVIINPRIKSEIINLSGNVIIRHIRYLPRIEFFGLVTNSDLFIELNIDEELRDATIEAALLLTPVAKLTHPELKDRCDYSEDDLIHAYSFNELIEKLLEYIRNIEVYRPIYSKRLRNFIIRNRAWNAVKKQLVYYLREDT